MNEKMHSERTRWRVSENHITKEQITKQLEKQRHLKEMKLRSISFNSLSNKHDYMQHFTPHIPHKWLHISCLNTRRSLSDSQCSSYLFMSSCQALHHSTLHYLKEKFWQIQSAFSWHNIANLTLLCGLYFLNCHICSRIPMPVLLTRISLANMIT